MKALTEFLKGLMIGTILVGEVALIAKRSKLSKEAAELMDVGTSMAEVRRKVGVL